MTTAWPTDCISTDDYIPNITDDCPVCPVCLVCLSVLSFFNKGFDCRLYTVGISARIGHQLIEGRGYISGAR